MQSQTFDFNYEQCYKFEGENYLDKKREEEKDLQQAIIEKLCMQPGRTKRTVNYYDIQNVSEDLENSLPHVNLAYIFVLFTLISIVQTINYPCRWNL